MEQLLNLRNLLEHQIEDLYSAEEQIIDALPKMIETAKDTMLRKALNEHLVITREHKKRLDRIRAIFGKDHEQEDSEVSTATKSFLERVFGGGTKCKGMEGLLKEGDKVIKEDMDPQVKDAAIIAAAQKVEHYEISGYGTARAYAAQLKMAEVEKLLQTTLNEEYKADDLLTALALGKVNKEAESGAMGSRQRNARKNGAKKSPRKKAAVKTASKQPVKKSAKKSVKKGAKAGRSAKK